MVQTSMVVQRRLLAQAIESAHAGGAGAVERAGELFAETDFYGLVEHYRAYAALGEQQRGEAAEHLAVHAEGCRFMPRTGVRMLNAIMDLGPAEAPRLRRALGSLQREWEQAPLTRTCLGVFRRPLAEVEAAFVPQVVGEALRSLRVDPERFLPHRTDGFVMRREERVVAELAVGTIEQRGQLAAVLVELAWDEGLSPVQRHRAACALAQVDPAASRDCAARLRARGIEDPGDHMPDPAVVARVEAGWQRIERAMNERFPQLLKELGPPLSPQEVAVCRQILGIPDAFAACLARHRYAFLFPDELHYEDMGRMISDVDEEWWEDDGDWGDLPDLADDDAWLEHLRAYAERLESAES